MKAASIIKTCTLNLAANIGPKTQLAVIASPGLMRLCGAVVRRLYTMALGDSSSYSMAFITVPNLESAKTLARGIVSGKLAACVNIIPQITSVYEWEGKIEEDSELLLMVKTRTSRMDDLSKYIRENHPYDVPEVISSVIDKGNPPYLKWIGEIVPEKKDT